MDFNTWKQFYNWEWCIKEDLKQAVAQGMLTFDQYNEIVNPNTQTQNPTNTNGITVTEPESTTTSVNANTKQQTKDTDSAEEPQSVPHQTTPSTSNQ